MTRSLIILLMFFSASCNYVDTESVTVDFNDTIAKGLENNDEPKAIYIAIASMTSPKETYIYYSELIDYIAMKIDRPIFIQQKKTYEEVNELLKNSDVDFAFICSGAYVADYSSKNQRLLVAPVIEQKMTYQAYIITQKDSKIENFDDFENKSFAFTDPLSSTGRLYPLKKLKNLNKNEQEFFLKTVYTNGHDISIQMVNRGIIDGASVHGLIYDYLAQHHPERVENVKIVERSANYGIPPVVTPASLDQKIFEKYQNVFLDIHNDSIGKNILDNLNIDNYQVVGDTLYRSVFQLKEYTDNVAKK
jgi:phosphonate transport system substrate-binding protein